MTQILENLAMWMEQSRWLSPLLALAAGIITSLTPCSLSSVPMVIAYIGGSAKREADEKGMTRRAFRLSLVMAAGLSLTFLAFGAAASALGHYLHAIGPWWYLFLGILMVAMALQTWGVIHIMPDHPHDHGEGEGHPDHGCDCYDPHHQHEKEHRHPKHCGESHGECHCGPRVGRRGYFGALLAGMMSGAVASHCSTPVMIALLALAAQSGEAGRGIFLLLMFALGHSILLVAAGTAYSVVERWMYDPKYGRISSALRRAMGAAILLIGVLMFCHAWGEWREVLETASLL